MLVLIGCCIASGAFVAVVSFWWGFNAGRTLQPLSERDCLLREWTAYQERYRQLVLSGYGSTRAKDLLDPIKAIERRLIALGDAVPEPVETWEVA
ncbi:MAG: hypothetical protein KBF28_05340 [Gemmatimonadales bacterium]|nr:hypothetical protein [Gemmatimonadales bacterium]